jgi:NADH:ubiquinone oxidoreductase subunit E
LSSEPIAAAVLPEEQLRELDEYIGSLNIDLESPRRQGYLIQILHRAQALFGCLPEPLQLYISDSLAISHAEVSGVISFYNFFSVNPRGRYRISVCMGTACFVKGAEKILEEFQNFLKIGAGQVTEDGMYSLDALRCIGACGLAPVVLVNEKVYGNVTVKQVGDILEECLTMETEQ